MAIPSNVGGHLVQLLYRSTSTSGVTSALQMSDILAEARARNAELEVTGALTAVNGQFVQIIEGPEPGIDALMVKLEGDKRHSELRILQRRFVATRAFAEWDMVSPRLAVTEADELVSMLARNETSLDAYVAVLHRAITHQDAMLEGMEAPTVVSSQAVSGSEPRISNRRVA